VTARRGIAVFGASLGSMAVAAAAADRARFDSVWTSELYNRSATVTLAALAPRTSACVLGSGIMYGVGRSPLMLAAEARDLDELSHGRFVLGLGNGTRRMISDWHGLDGSARAVRLEELVPLLRRVWLAEAPVDHDGRFYRLRIAALDDLASAPRRDIPIYTAGVNPRMIEAAGRVADGLLGHTLFSPRYIADVVGRRSSAAPYAGLFDACGFASEAETIRAAFAAGDVEAMVGAVTEAMVDELAVAGTPAEVGEQLRRFDGVVDEVVLSPPTFRVAPERVAENLATLIEHCAPQ
jgi:alkanesulfonate monooxygenase SsuD/methylene tetrahydromethanopterin reductase-like flavin-dependent oxidoreductase (luciferase family)